MATAAEGRGPLVHMRLAFRPEAHLDASGRFGEHDGGAHALYRERVVHEAIRLAEIGLHIAHHLLRDDDVAELAVVQERQAIERTTEQSQAKELKDLVGSVARAEASKAELGCQS